MTKTVYGILLGILMCVALTIPVLADDLKVTVGVENGTAETKVIGADIYATIDGKVTEILVRPDDQAFFLKGKFGALTLGSFWSTNAKTKKAIK